MKYFSVMPNNDDAEDDESGNDEFGNLGNCALEIDKDFAKCVKADFKRSHEAPLPKNDEREQQQFILSSWD